MEDKTGKKGGRVGAPLTAALIFLVAGAIGNVYAENRHSPAASEENTGEKTVSPLPSEVSEARRSYDRITWHDVVSSGPNHLGYAMIVSEKPARAGGLSDHPLTESLKGEKFFFVTLAPKK